MGWLFTKGQTRKQLIAERTHNEEHDNRKWTCLAHCYKGGPGTGVLWTVWELDRGNGEVIKYIGCDLLQYHKSFGWGYKDMDESMGPYYYTCPLKYLAMVQLPNPINIGWRMQVIAYHEEQKRQREAKKQRA